MNYEYDKNVGVLFLKKKKKFIQIENDLKELENKLPDLYICSDLFLVDHFCNAIRNMICSAWFRTGSNPVEMNLI